MRWRTAMLAAALLAATGTGHASATSSTSSDADPDLAVMTQINQVRIERGLAPLLSDGHLWGLAEDRATRLAASGVLSHEVAGSMPNDLAVHDLRWFAYGEVIGYVTGTPQVAGPVIFRMWMESPSHWPLLMSADFNYLGVSLVYRPSSGVTFASVVMTQSPDRTGARAAVTAALVSGNDISWSFRGWDPPLQTRTAGLRDFALQLRMDDGAWVTIASGLATTARSTLNRARGHWYGLRVRARDRAGNVGPWSRELRVWLP